MSITDEMREYADKNWRNGYPVEGIINISLNEIADRIDAEHERAVMSAMNDALYHANDESMAELGWVRLPKDADNVPWNVGDRDEDGNVVTELRMEADGYWWIRARGICRRPERCRHYHAPTVEDVLTEMFAKAIERGELTNGAAQTIAEYAAKLRLAGEDA